VTSCLLVEAARRILHLHRSVTGGLLLIFALNACFSIQPGTTLAPAAPTARRIERAAWIQPIQIADPSVARADRAASQLTLSFQKYIEQTSAFRSVGILPADMSQDDIVLSLRFERYRQARKLHPAYLPAALLTFSLYIWFGGPIYRDEIDLNATLQLLSASGSVLAQATTERRESRTTNVWSTEYMLPSGLQPRTAAIQTLLDDALSQLKGTTQP
jgi:hypothetical protein